MKSRLKNNVTQLTKEAALLLAHCWSWLITRWTSSCFFVYTKKKQNYFSEATALLPLWISPALSFRQWTAFWNLLQAAACPKQSCTASC